jgi:threonylcarbamoyladenosine tRNA methylthiotransferase MtaB
MKKVAFYTLGCKLNYAETSTLSRMFEQRGYRKTAFTDKPDIFIINTCSVTEQADKKCRKVVREARHISPDAFIAIVGCYAQLKPQEIAGIPGVDAVLGAAEKFQLIDLLDGFVRTPQPRVLTSDIEKANRFHTSFSIGDRTRTFLKVQDGCDYSCSFCTIPLARGRSRSDSIENIVRTVRQVGETGVREIVLTGVNTGDFGIRDGRRVERFLDLIRELDNVEGIDRFRISSIEPNLLSDEIIEFVASSQRFAPHFHIPLQSGSDKILRLMRRRYLRNVYEKRVEKIKKVMPRACIGADVMVGFPGETSADFLETYRFINELDISYLHVFPYSERENTPASTMTPVVPHAERAERSKMLHILSDKKRRAFYLQNVGCNARVLYEHDIEDGQMHGFTENYIRVSATFDPLLVNEIVNVRLIRVNEKGLMEAEETEAQPAAHLHH